MRNFSVWKHIGGILFISSFLIYNFFFVEKISVYPWWHSTGNDVDAANAATTLGMLNNTGLTHLYHPGATIYHCHGLVYRVVSFLNPFLKEIFDLQRINTMEEAFEVLDVATRISRIVVLAMALFFLIIFYMVVYRWTQHRGASFFAAFYVMTSRAFSWHTYWVRPDLPALIFFFLAVWIVLKIWKKEMPPMQQLSAVILVGFLIGFAIFSKLQIVPAIAIFLGVILISIFRERGKGGPKTFSPKPHLSSLAAVANIVLMPWWALQRPPFITHEYLNSLHRLSDIRRLYGPAPESFGKLAASTLIIFLVVSILLIVLERKYPSRFEQWGRMITFLNLILTGMILSVYFIFLPVSGSLEMYWQNTNHVVYAALTNAIYNPYLENRAISFVTFLKIFYLHEATTRMAFVNILWIVILAAGVTIYRLIQKKTSAGQSEILILILLATAFLMDLFSSLRAVRPRIHEYYAIYSICFYAAGLALWVVQELKNFSGRRVRWVGHVALGFFALHIVWMSVSLFTQPKASGYSDQTPLQEFRNTRAHAGPFWEKVEEILKRHP